MPILEKFEFFASTLRCYTEDEVAVIGLADDDADPTHYVILSRFDDEENGTAIDDANGLQTSMSEQETTAAIASILMSADRLELLIKPDKANQVGARRIIANFDEQHDELESVSRYLSIIFTGSNTLIKRSGLKDDTGDA